MNRGIDDSELASNFLQDMLRSIPPLVEYDETLTQSELEEQLTLAKLLTSSVWLNLLNKSLEKNGKFLTYNVEFIYLFFHLTNKQLTMRCSVYSAFYLPWSESS